MGAPVGELATVRVLVCGSICTVLEPVAPDESVARRVTSYRESESWSLGAVKLVSDTPVGASGS